MSGKVAVLGYYWTADPMQVWRKKESNSTTNIEYVLDLEGRTARCFQRFSEEVEGDHYDYDTGTYDTEWRSTDTEESVSGENLKIEGMAWEEFKKQPMVEQMALLNGRSVKHFGHAVRYGTSEGKQELTWLNERFPRSTGTSYEAQRVDESRGILTWGGDQTREKRVVVIVKKALTPEQIEGIRGLIREATTAIYSITHPRSTAPRVTEDFQIAQRVFTQEPEAANEEMQRCITELAKGIDAILT